MRFRSVRRCAPLCLALSLLVLPLWAEEFDVEKQRAGYIRSKEALASELLRGVNRDKQGRIIKDDVYKKAVAEFEKRDWFLKKHFSENGKRDTKLDNLFREHGVDPKSAREIRGSARKSSEYRDFLSDRDMVLNKDQAMKLAKGLGDKCKVGRNYVRIPGLDVNIYFGPSVEGVGNLKASLGDPEVIIRDTPTQHAKKIAGHFDGDVPSKTNDQLEMLHDLDKTVMKSDQAVRDAGGEPVLTDDEAARTRNRKAGKDTEAELEFLALSKEDRKKFLESKREEAARKVKQAKDNYEKTRTKKIDQLSQEGNDARKLAEKAKANGDDQAAEKHTKRAQEVDTKRREMTKERQLDDLTAKVTEKKHPEFSEKVNKPAQTGDDTGPTKSGPTDDGPATKTFPPDDAPRTADRTKGSEAAGEKPKTSRRKKLLMLLGALAGSKPTQGKAQPSKGTSSKPTKPTNAAGPKVSQKPTVDAPSKPAGKPATKPKGVSAGADGPTPGQARAQKGLSWIGRIMGAYDAYKTERDDAKEEGRDFSLTRMGVHTVLNVTGITGAWNAGQSMRYETTKGTKAYIKRQLAEYKAAGYDVNSMKVRLWIAAKAIARGTALGSYEGAKGLPIIGDIVAAPENAFRVAEATIGLIHDTAQSNATIARNEIQQADTEAAALQAGQRQYAALKKLAALINEQDGELKKMAVKGKKALAAMLKMRDQLRQDQTVLAAMAQNASVLSGSLNDARSRIKAMDGTLSSIRTSADQLSGSTGVAIQQLKAGKTRPETARDMLVAINSRYEALLNQCRETMGRLDALHELTQTDQANDVIAQARARVASVATDMQKAAAFAESMNEIANVQRDAIAQFDLRRKAVLDGLLYFFVEADLDGPEEQQFLQLREAVEELVVEKRSVDEVLKLAEQMGRGVKVLSGMAQKMPIPPDTALKQTATSQQVAREFQQLKGPAQAADAALARLRSQMTRLRDAINSYVAVVQDQENQARKQREEEARRTEAEARRRREEELRRQQEARNRNQQPGSLTGRKPGETKSVARRRIMAERDKRIAELRKAMANDPQRMANKKQALANGGKPRKITCSKCGFSGMHYWFGDRWSCPRCERCTMLSDVKRADGLTYRQFAAQRIKVYEDQIQQVRQQADQLLRALNR